MTKAQFKKRWESAEDGGGITNDDAAACAVKWGLMASPKARPISYVVYSVLKAAGVNDAEDYNPKNQEDEG